MTLGRSILSFVVFLSFAFCAGAEEYEAKWASLDKRPVPQWWQDAKFGNFAAAFKAENFNPDAWAVL